MLEYPRMLFRGDDTLVVANAEQKAAALAEGFETRWLPCDGPRPEPAPEPAPEPEPEVIDATPAAEPKTKKGRAAKE